MAGYRQHISVSGFLGVAYGAGLYLWLGFSPSRSVVAAVLTWVSGMLPDLDSDTGKPIREVFSLLAAVVPMMLIDRLREIGGDAEGAMMLSVFLYILIRYGGAWLLARFSVHRGMFHSIPALLIAAETAFLIYQSSSSFVRLMMAVGVAIGFLSHLVLDEMYAVQWTGLRIKLNKFAGSAVKMAGTSLFANAFTYGLLMAMTYMLLLDQGIIKEPPLNDPRQMLPSAVKQAPVRR